MTNKTIEKVALAIHDAEPLDQTEEHWEDLVGQAKAAIQALDIIILPYNAKPEEGDIVIMQSGRTGYYGEYYRLAMKETREVSAYPDDKGELVVLTPHDSIRTIQRNGKPVIQEHHHD